MERLLPDNNPYIKRATFSEDRAYRYTLHRIWDKDKPLCGFIMMNPSTADENHLDPTLKRCKYFAREWDYGGMAIANIFALRSTDPKGLLEVADPIGPENDAAILSVYNECGLTVAAMGFL